ncbi:MAG TPA: hypothetical protein VGN69_10115 [Solirubrobacteraceae bacterium]|nr:hypothetical protein [Solirubrobacteraceae bacterium]
MITGCRARAGSVGAGRALALTLLLALALVPAAAGASARAAVGPDLTRRGGRPAPDPLSGNGMRSALCRSVRLRAHLSPVGRQNCVSSGLVFAVAPVEHYAFDTHIDTSVSPLSQNNQLAIVQGLLLTPIWTALVWISHALIVALEWSFSLDLLDGRTLGPVTEALRSARRAFSDPWLASALAVAGMLVVYRGLIQRRVGDTVADVAAMLAMTAAGLWLIADPVGTVGAAGRLVNDAAVGTVAAVSNGSPSRASGVLGDDLRGVFEATVTGPWCYLEFGNVDWCNRPAALDPRLREVAMRLAGGGPLPDACRTGGDFTTCVSLARRGPGELARENALVHRARTNGELFLAFPANGTERNSITSDSLLRALCGSGDATQCSAPTAAQAQFRTEGGTWPRVGGLLFIAVGMVGMFALLAFVALRLLGAALLTVVYLLLAPAAVLSPALGDWGRGVFRAWAGRLLAALSAKLLYSVLLGALLLMLRVLTALGSLGWWVQWLLIAAFWWVVYVHRHRWLQGAAVGGVGERPRGAGRPLAHHLRRGAGQSLRVLGGAGRIILDRARERHPPPASGIPRAPATRARAGRRPAPSASSGSGTAGLGADRDTAAARADRERGRIDQAERLLEGRHAEARALGAHSPAGGSDARPRGTLEALRLEENRARQRGDTRRAQSLALRAQRREQAMLAREGLERDAAETAAVGERHRQRTGLIYDPGQRAAAVAELERQAWLRRGISPGPRRPPREYRDYRRLAALGGLTSAAYQALPAGDQRRARLHIDRELERYRDPGGDAARGRHPDGRRRADGPGADGRRDTGEAGAPRGLRRAMARAVPAAESVRQRRARQLLSGAVPED